MRDEYNSNEFYSIIKTATIIAIIIAIIITGYLLIFTEKQHSSLYIIPESYQTQSLNNDRVSFTYGVTCSEKKNTDYEIQIYLNDNIMVTEQLQLDNNQKYEKNQELLMTGNVTYPAKIQVILTNKNTRITEEVHFWVKDNR